jgi:hypothetical protein
MFLLNYLVVLSFKNCFKRKKIDPSNCALLEVEEIEKKTN